MTKYTISFVNCNGRCQILVEFQLIFVELLVLVVMMKVLTEKQTWKDRKGYIWGLVRDQHHDLLHWSPTNEEV